MSTQERARNNFYIFRARSLINFLNRSHLDTTHDLGSLATHNIENKFSSR